MSDMTISPPVSAGGNAKTYTFSASFVSTGDITSLQLSFTISGTTSYNTSQSAQTLIQGQWQMTTLTSTNIVFTYIGPTPPPAAMPSTNFVVVRQDNSVGGNTVTVDLLVNGGLSDRAVFTNV